MRTECDFVAAVATANRDDGVQFGGVLNHAITSDNVTLSIHCAGVVPRPFPRSRTPMPE